MQFVLNPLMDYYAARRATGREKLPALKGPVILVANHASHMDTPVILSALPRKLRKRTAVAAAADYFYRNRLVASIVSLIFNTVPIERKGGGGMAKNGSHLDTLLDEGWNLLLYPEGTRSRGGGPGRVRRGAAVLAAAHNLADHPDPGHRHRRGDATGPAVAQAAARQAPVQAPPDHGLLRRADPAQRRRHGRPDRAGAELLRQQGDGGPSRSPYRRQPATTPKVGGPRQG